MEKCCETTAGFSQYGETIMTWSHLSPQEYCVSSSKFKNLASKELFSAQNWLELKPSLHPFSFQYFQRKYSMCCFLSSQIQTPLYHFWNLMATHGFFLTWRVHKIPRCLLLHRAAIYCSISLQLPAWRKEKGCLLGPSCSNGEEDQLHCTCSCPFFSYCFHRRTSLSVGILPPLTFHP